MEAASRQAGAREAEAAALRASLDQVVRAAAGGSRPAAGRWDGYLGRHPATRRWLVRPMRLVWAVITLRVPRFLRTDPLFDGDWYLRQYPDVARSRLPLYWHYWRHGAAEGRDPNPFFDTDWYLARYPDVREHGMNPLDHYHRFGWTEGRDPSPGFSTIGYLRDNIDVLASGMDPLLHYLRYGAREGRKA
jgi:hypothetical protein